MVEWSTVMNRTSYGINKVFLILMCIVIYGNIYILSVLLVQT